MKCTSKFWAYILIFAIMASLLTACADEASLRMPFCDFEKISQSENLSIGKTGTMIAPFAEDFCVFAGEHTDLFSIPDSQSGILVDMSDNEVVFSENAFEERGLASITKVMTAYIALKMCDLDEIITCTNEVSEIKVSDAVVLGLKKGDQLTIDQALRLFLLSSYNDVAIAIACHISGTEAAFAELMNEEAYRLGCTHTHFSDSNGLSEDNHYTTAYDMYLIFKEAIKDEIFYEIISSKSYSTTYTDKNGKAVNASSSSTNQYFRGTYAIPENVTIIGGKTGTTTEAGYCLCLLVRDRYANPYIAIIFGADSRNNLYSEMTSLLDIIE